MLHQNVGRSHSRGEIRLCSEIEPHHFFPSRTLPTPPTFLSDGAEFLLKFNVVTGTLDAVCQAGDRGLKVRQLGTQVGVRWVETDGRHTGRQRDLRRMTFNQLEGMIMCRLPDSHDEKTTQYSMMVPVIQHLACRTGEPWQALPITFRKPAGKYQIKTKILQNPHTAIWDSMLRGL